jgi:hypothetical protein
MKHYQDIETGLIYAFEDDVDVNILISNNRNLPKSLSEIVVEKPSENHVWYKGLWMDKNKLRKDYIVPTSSVPIYNPAWTVFLFPVSTFIIGDDVQKPSFTLEEINQNTYNGKEFSKIVTQLDLENSIEPALISYDGAIAIPNNRNFSTKTDAIKALNRIIGALFIGGINIEVVDYERLESGALQEDDINLFSYKPSLHSYLRHNWAALVDRMSLLSPQIIDLTFFHSAYEFGNQFMSQVPNFSPEFLVRGHTALQNRNLSDALSNLWIVVEQLTSHIWEKSFVQNNKFHPKDMLKRKDFLKDRVWTISMKQEMLWQTKFISDECYVALFQARSARNSLVHSGTMSDVKILESLWINLFELFKVASDQELNELIKLTTYTDNKSLLGFQHKHHEFIKMEGDVNFDGWLKYQNNDK